MRSPHLRAADVARRSPSQGGSGRLVTAVRSVLAQARASPWSSFIAKGVAVGCALLLLAWIGAAPGSGAAAAALDGGLLAPALTLPDAAPELASPPPAAAEGGAPSPVAAGTTTSHARASPTDPVYLNRAGPEDLRRLPGVGEKRADAILTLRQRLGRFQRIEDLLRVKGVGRTTLRKWRPLVRLDTPDAGS